MAQPTRPTDGALLAEFLATRSQAAFTELVSRHGTMVHGVALRVLADHHEAQDVTQAVLLTLAKKAPALCRSESVGGWLHTVAWRTATDAQRSRRSRQRREETAMRDQPKTATAHPEAGLFRAELDAALNQLPERYRQPLVLFHLEDRSLEETSQATGLNLNTLCTRLARARELLRKKLVRRGVTVGSVGALTALLSAESGAAVLPSTFVASTVGAATGTAAVSATVAALSKGALHMLFIAKIKTAVLITTACLIVAGTGVVAGKQLVAPSPTPPTRAVTAQPSAVTPAASATLPEPTMVLAQATPLPTAETVPALIKGEKVLASFWHYPVVQIPDKGGTTVEEFAAGQRAAQDKVLQAIQSAGANVLRVVRVSDGNARYEYSSLLLLDCKGQSPEKVLRVLPYFLTAIVFQDGQYGKGLPVQMEAKYLFGVKKGQVPAPYAFYALGGSAYANILKGEQDVKRFQTIPGVNVEATPPSGAKGGGWSAKLTPAAGHTLLEVFLLTETGFKLVDP
jgi:RNA polymerase sigma factor (sigma-70 family)